MNEQEENTLFEEVDILGSIEFDLTEGVKDLIWNIKTIKKDVEGIKKYLNFPGEG